MRIELITRGIHDDGLTHVTYGDVEEFANSSHSKMTLFDLLNEGCEITVKLAGGETLNYRLVDESPLTSEDA